MKLKFAPIMRNWHNVRAPPPPPPLDPAIIENAPLVPTVQAAPFADDRDYLEIIGSLSAELAEVEAENVRLKDEQTVETVKAKMMRPYANKIFWFVVAYCAFVGFVVLLSGSAGSNFHLSDTILGILAGSTAVAVIGLIGTVVGGLFGVSKAS